MTVTFYSNISENNALSKQINQVGGEADCILKEESSIIDPVIMVKESYTDVISRANYAQIKEFHRYYFIKNVESVRNGLWRIYMHIDVLYTYRNNIKSNHAIIERSESLYDLKLNDGLFVTQQKPRITEHEFPYGFSQWNYVLALAGNSGGTA